MSLVVRLAARGVKRKWRLVLISLILLSIICCFVILESIDTLYRRHEFLAGEWRFKRMPKRKNNMGIFKIKDSFRWMSNKKATDANDESDILVFPKLDDSNESNGDEDIVSPMSGAVVRRMLQYPERNYTERVLILTPIHNVGSSLQHYAKILKSFSYPHNLISVALGEDGSTDDTMLSAKMTGVNLSRHFNKVQVFQLNLTGGIHGDWYAVHDLDVQFSRRRHLADARNLLLKKALSDEDWVLWIDSDVDRMPVDIIQQLLSARKGIVAPACVIIDPASGKKRVYDKNTWRETPESIRYLKAAPPNKLMLEGYGPSHRIWLPHLRKEGRVVPLDGVGGCTLLINAKYHRKGLVFPSFIYKNHIETEGLAKLAKDMKFGVYGMPFVEVVHS